MEVERARDPVAARPPRRLRLDELLRELGADDAKPSAGAPERVRASSVTLGELVDKAAEGGFGFVIGVLALLAIPFFGLSTPFGLAIALLGAQLALGKQRPWLPKRVRARHLSMAMLDRVLRLLAKRMRWLARMTTRRRYEVLITPRWIGFGITLLALGLALPLPIPGSNLIFIIPILIYSIALLERDGVWSTLGHLCTVIDMTLLVVFGATVIAVLQSVWNWIT
ncbi:MAG TPA: exopolysaccharide biosynthesis protein [Kofleriaceae bacterium]